MSGIADNIWFRFLLAALATWRVTHLLANEDGPADLIFRIRRLLGNSIFGKLADCFQCLSVWIAIPMAFYIAGNWVDRVLCWLALSGAACLLERGSGGNPPPVVFQKLDS